MKRLIPANIPANTARVATRRPQGIVTKYGVLKDEVDLDARGDWDLDV